MTRNRKYLLLMLLSITVINTGCSSIPFLNDKKIDYQSAGKAPPLEVPPDLTVPSADERFTIPDTSPKGTATYSTYSKERTAKPQPGSTNLLPDQEKISIERAGTQRWLVVNMAPEEIWPMVKDFWQELGFIVQTESPEAGIIETDWAENRAKIPQDFIRRSIGKVFEGLYSSGERDKFRTRLERGNKPGTTEVYISHRGMQEVVKGANTTSEQVIWEPRPADPELEAEMLRRLMVRFGIEDARAQSMVAATSTPQRAVIDRSRSGAQLKVNESFDRAWRRVGLALDRVGFTVEDRDRSKGVYYVRYVDPESDNKKSGIMSKLAFWKDRDKSNPEQYQILVADAGASSEIRVLSRTGEAENSDTSNRILNMLFEQLK